MRLQLRSTLNCRLVRLHRFLPLLRLRLSDRMILPYPWNRTHRSDHPHHQRQPLLVTLYHRLHPRVRHSRSTLLTRKVLTILVIRYFR